MSHPKALEQDVLGGQLATWLSLQPGCLGQESGLARQQGSNGVAGAFGAWNKFHGLGP